MNDNFRQFAIVAERGDIGSARDQLRRSWLLETGIIDF
jgi:hypothetical protein